LINSLLKSRLAIMREKDVPMEKVESLKEILAGDEESEMDFEVIENLVSVAVQSIVDERHWPRRL
jgi:hypothetical protein